MKRILVTGATGNVGIELIKCLHRSHEGFDIIAGVRDFRKDGATLRAYDVRLTRFDFTDIGSCEAALSDCDILFLMRPPQISDVGLYFKPLIRIAKTKGVQHIVFLSVQGVEKSRLFPHNKIEQLIVESGLPYTFLRPAYFMQNFCSTLYEDLVYRQKIYLPAGHAKFTLIDVRDIGAVAAAVVSNAAAHVNQAYELTGGESLSFNEMAQRLSVGLSQTISYKSPNLLLFLFTKLREGLSLRYILVLIVLHYLPRFQTAPAITDWVEKLAGRQPLFFKDFIADNKQLLCGKDMYLHFATYANSYNHASTIPSSR
jgi:uncharacterized protein YbjT (DUF2867 family)